MKTISNLIRRRLDILYETEHITGRKKNLFTEICKLRMRKHFKGELVLTGQNANVLNVH